MEGDVGCDEEVADFEERLRSEEAVACTGVTLAKRSRLAANREKSTLASGKLPPLLLHHSASQ